ncbi:MULTISPECIES: class I SAM-dependent methyltransferase [Flectobacillus]|uniref:Class I SAM-dependent methyltransferase n=1 Tax=Flectobacillus roseus TaxID=502259 RepID=A0ABT6Y2I6_9BACT|nr:MULTISPECIES: class I SAM-dependent methyltransferase [Flectobacillus]MDI9857783.1 class I SAM-dependent methyltransferase [Flectobacillus roseus]MDI9869486.1 class I SAM-dependent methyltransferase [Flectobacillus roseus]NBA76440.1 oxidoreductase [Emticicia sp. ODNR4P]PAC27349.1 oxidoreductase [Flectobacillus sp. BAB-3569]
MSTTVIQTATPKNWKAYQLLDSGGFEKLEKFGDYILRRPEPQAAWDKSLSELEWQNSAHAYFKKDKGSQEKGEWMLKKGMVERWYMPYQTPTLNLNFKLALSSFKHVGIFPEQAMNWDFIMEKVKKMPVKNPKVLNLFAYTGGASIAAKQAGADVTHVDSIKQVISWSRDNMEASQLDNIRWVVEDAMKFVRREAKRGNVYQGIILDPPAYGRGPDGEKWVLEEQINEMLKTVAQILDKENYFLILNMYSMGFSSLIVENLVKCSFEHSKNHEFGELYLEDSFKKKLPLGVYYRFASI